MGKRNNETLEERKERAIKTLVQARLDTEQALYDSFEEIAYGLDGITDSVVLPHRKLPFLTSSYKNLGQLEVGLPVEIAVELQKKLFELDSEYIDENGKIITPSTLTFENIDDISNHINNYLNHLLEEVKLAKPKDNYIRIIRNELDKIHNTYERFINTINKIYAKG